jgi:hypothetical protein
MLTDCEPSHGRTVCEYWTAATGTWISERGRAVSRLAVEAEVSIVERTMVTMEQQWLLWNPTPTICILATVDCNNSVIR